jgi:predicted esterase
MATSEDSSSTDDIKTIRVLAFHGSEGTAEEFPTRLDALKTALADNHNVKLEITAVQAPFVKGKGFSWWNMPPGIRSFTATEYEGFEDSVAEALDVWSNNNNINAQQQQPFDMVLGHSQGAILVAALITLGRIPYHPANGYILNGVSFPNPYKAQVEALKVDDDDAPRVLFLMGVNDKITPNSTGEQLRDGFQQAGLKVSTMKHPGGHGFPGNRDETMNDIVGWILQQD